MPTKIEAWKTVDGFTFASEAAATAHENRAELVRDVEDYSDAESLEITGGEFMGVVDVFQSRLEEYFELLSRG
jgi:hypothetical protein